MKKAIVFNIFPKASLMVKVRSQTLTAASIKENGKKRKQMVWELISLVSIHMLVTGSTIFSMVTVLKSKQMAPSMLVSFNMGRRKDMAI